METLMGFPQLNLLAFTSGRVVAIENVSDPVFAGRMMGDGIAIDPVHNAGQGVLSAPCAGRITQLHSSRHACFLEADNGARILLHIGVDTVLLKGEGFTTHVAQGDVVRAGQPLIEFDIDLLRRKNKPTVVILVIENGDDFHISSRAEHSSISMGDPLLTLVATNTDAALPANAPVEADDVETANGWAVVRHGGGLHARPCALLANALKPFAAAVEVRVRGASANARSATAMMGLSVAEGEEVELRATGHQAGDAIEAAITALETVSVAASVAPTHTTFTQLGAGNDLPPTQFAGVIASPGLAMGLTARFEHAIRAVKEQGDGEIVEQRALTAALQALGAELATAVADAEQRQLVEQAEIFAAHRVLVEDPELLAASNTLIAAGKSAAFAWQTAIETQCRILVASNSPLLAGRASDLRDIERQVLRKLAGDDGAAPLFARDAVVLADDLLPSDFTALEQAGVAAIVTAQGGPTSHVAILARARGIPTLVATGPRLTGVPAGVQVIVDANNGLLDTAPSPERLVSALTEISQRQEVQAQMLARAHEPAVTIDGVRIEIAANIATATDAAKAVTLGAESVGLLRTELLFLDRQTAPTQDEQRAAYQAVIDALEGRSAIIRTLDVGADKSLPYIPMPQEDNPALGQRGIRLSLAREALLTEQLRAILAVQPRSAVKIMLPMVTDLAELVATRVVLDRLAAEMGVSERVELGVMIETPAAAVLADQLAQEADFFSVGSNDLTQYALCMDRTNPALAARVDALHPSVLRLLALAAQGAAGSGRWLGVCGAMASDPMAVPLLIGLGATELSVSPAVIPEIKSVVRQLNLAECQSVAQAVLQLTSAEAIRAYVRQVWPWLDAAKA
ncbi:phosphoenolpyruvate--protein phosphotransferase [Rhodoferax sp. BLA1]|uniref:phosphoenolpyruvate--protein phosphotransferase n=1 Tax=Rhodoferax sp. BLA1 TaxID=2576062 RepID=UPI00210684F8|nr:phosphoenolpyruvate--protein phosphotransferase [Rhodoferax sp. BLA1]